MYGLQVAVGYLRVYPTLETMTDVWPTDYSSRHSSRLYASDNQRAGTSRVIHPYPGQQDREREMEREKKGQDCVFHCSR
jgi:hypothetical protein